MQYDCECGCSKKVEKIIVFSQACRMRLRRKSVMKDNESVNNHNDTVIKDNTPVIEHNEDSEDDYVEEQRECVFCYKKWPVNEDGNVWCKKCKQATIYNAME